MIAAVLLAAGQSRRMGRQKMVLPWRDGKPIIAHVAQVFLDAGASPVVVVTGADRERVEAALKGMPVHTVYNPNHAEGEMLSSVQAGLRSLDADEFEAAAVAPGDLPLLSPETVRALLARWRARASMLLAPSYERRRGHPMLLARAEWPGVIELERGKTMRDFFRKRAEDIEYLVVDDPGVLADVDTLGQYDEATRGKDLPR
ncbi:MAG: nucleotidyltransferase family protein [Anaerolineales bacterium]